jgi:hypothetical protein
MIHPLAEQKLFKSEIPKVTNSTLSNSVQLLRCYRYLPIAYSPNSKVLTISHCYIVT